jgi:hypothetical protein
MKAFEVSGFAALIGIDWADRKHDICEVNLQTNKRQFSIISSKPTAINAWANELKTWYKGQLVAVACELKKRPLIYALSKFSHIVLFPINLSTVAKYRKAFAQNGAKDDTSDAAVEVEILQLHMSKLKVITPESVTIRKLVQQAMSE